MKLVKLSKVKLGAVS